MAAMKFAKPLFVLLLPFCCAAAVPPDDHNALRRALERNEVVPFTTILEWVEAHYVGKIIEVELENEDGELNYEVELLSPRGDVIEFEFDARSGELKRIKGPNIDAAKRSK